VVYVLKLLLEKQKTQRVVLAMRDDEFLLKYGGAAFFNEGGEIRDEGERFLGYFTPFGNSIEIRDVGGRLIGYVEKDTGYIRDAGGRLVGYVTKRW